MYEAALPRLFGLFLARQNAVRINGRELTKFLSQLFRSGFAVGINRAGGTGPPRSFGLVIRGGAKGDTPKIVERLLRAGMPIRLAVQDIQKPGGRTVHELGTSPDRSVAWWTERRRSGRQPDLAHWSRRHHRCARGPGDQCDRPSQPPGALAQRGCGRIRARRTGFLRYGRTPPPALQGCQLGPRSDQAIRLSMGVSGRVTSEHRGGSRAGPTDGDPGDLRSAHVRLAAPAPPAERARRIHGRFAGWGQVGSTDP